LVQRWLVRAGVRQWFAPKEQFLPQPSPSAVAPVRSRPDRRSRGMPIAANGTSNGVPSELPPIDRVKSQSWGSTTLPPFVMASLKSTQLPQRKSRRRPPMPRQQRQYKSPPHSLRSTSCAPSDHSMFRTTLRAVRSHGSVNSPQCAPPASRGPGAEEGGVPGAAGFVPLLSRSSTPSSYSRLAR
jgi:hypothetical protein